MTMDPIERPETPALRPVSLERLLDALEHGVFVVEKGFISAANAAMARISRHAKPDLIGRRLSEILADPDGRPLSDPRAPDAVRIRDARGDLVPVSLRAVTDSLHLVIDRSRESRLEREVWRLTEQLHGSGRDPGAGDVPRDEYFGMIEHEIRTATTVIRGYSRMLLDERVGTLTESQSGFLREVRRASERISSLLDNLLEMASLECPAGLRVSRRPVALHGIVRAAVDGARPLLEDRGMRIELDLRAEPDSACADAARLEQVLLNLLSNAAKFAPAESVVRVETRLVECDSGPAIEVSVCDEGSGVGEEEAEEIFAPFVRGRAATSGCGGGVGLGLALCRRILEAHGGSIEALPGEPGGAFRVTIPLDR
jgi:signal transduction histidine kinase